MCYSQNHSIQIQRSRQKIAQNEEVVWSGDASMCDKQLKHYPAFSRNGIDIAVSLKVLPILHFVTGLCNLF